MDYEMKKILLILIGVTMVGGLTGLFNILYGSIFVAVLVGYIMITMFWKELLIEIAKFVSSFIFPKRWRQ
jgi:hypothetical protein